MQNLKSCSGSRIRFLELTTAIHAFTASRPAAN